MAAAGESCETILSPADEVNSGEAGVAFNAEHVQWESVGRKERVLVVSNNAVR